MNVIVTQAIFLCLCGVRCQPVSESELQESTGCKVSLTMTLSSGPFNNHMSILTH
jgi:hypothetical protein